jgi:hypothetical protein
MSSFFLALDLFPFNHEHDDFLEAECPGCHGPIVVHQPDQNQPARLLGTCQSCSAWYLVDADAEVMVRLPEGDALRDTRSTTLHRHDEPEDINDDVPARRTASSSRRSRDGHRRATA